MSLKFRGLMFKSSGGRATLVSSGLDFQKFKGSGLDLGEVRGSISEVRGLSSRNLGGRYFESSGLDLVEEGVDLESSGLDVQ